MNNYDAIVIRGSNAGLSAAIQVARGRRSVFVLDGGDGIVGQVRSMLTGNVNPEFVRKADMGDPTKVA
jgi:thioredoxin reductase